MAALKDSLNYSKFDIIDSDDEDYVEKKIMQDALGSGDMASARNIAARAMNKKGETVSASSVSKTLEQTRMRMQQQVKKKGGGEP